MSDPQNFDQMYNGDNAFIIGGQMFHWRPLHWREWGELIDKAAAEEAAERDKQQKQIEALIKKGMNQDDAEAKVYDDETTVSAFEALVLRCTRYLVSDEIDAFIQVMEDKNRHISMAQVNALLVYLQESQTPERPTNPPSSSSPGPGTPAVTSLGG